MLSTEQTIKAYKYAEGILIKTTDIVDFIVSMMDVFGEESYEDYFLILSELKKDYSIPFSIPETPSLAEDLRVKCKSKLKEIQACSTNIDDFKQNLDELQFYIQQYRNSSEFKKMLDFVGKFKELAPYNAMLVEQQKPGSTFVLSLREWRDKFHRRPKLNAQKLITLLRFGPIQVMYDYDDTEHISGTEEINAEEVQKWKTEIESMFAEFRDNSRFMAVIMDNRLNLDTKMHEYTKVLNHYRRSLSLRSDIEHVELLKNLLQDNAEQLLGIFMEDLNNRVQTINFE